MFDIKLAKEAANKQIAEEKAALATKALVKKLRELDAAKSIVKNIEREIADLEQSISDGSFTG
jgi:hypothetical protein